MKFFSLAIFTASLLHTSGLTPIDLQVENETHPVGVSAKPHLSWKLNGKERGNTQISYQITAASTADKLAVNDGDLWKTKIIKTAQRRLIPWKGEALREGLTVYWKVTVTDSIHKNSITSKSAQFTVGNVRQLQPSPQIASFETNHTVINSIFQRNLKTLKRRIDNYTSGNNAGLGLGHEVQRSARDLMYLFNAASVLDDWIRKMHGAQSKLGLFPSGIGQFQGVGLTPSIANSDSAISVPHALWWMNGDSSIISNSWDTMEQHMICREKNDPSIQGVNWGSPLTLQQELTAEFVDLCYFGMTSRLMSEMAIPIQKPRQSIRYKDYSSRIRKSFKNQYLNSQGKLKIRDQSAAILALRSSVMDTATRQTVLDTFLASLPPLGEIDPLVAKPLLPILTITGNQQKAFEIVSDSKSPWANPDKPEFLACGVADWMMSSLAGIQARSPGFDQFRIAPQIPAGDSLTWVKASYDAPSGKVSIYWEKKDAGLHIQLKIPSGSLAQLSFPFQESQKITEGGKTIKDSFGIAEMRRDSAKETIDIIAQSGDYHFVIR